MIRIVFFILSSLSFAAAQEKLADWSNKINIVNQVEINTEHTEFSPSYWNEFIVFVASRPRTKIFDPNTKEAFFDLYYAAGNKEDALSKVALFSKNINTPSHEGPVTFNKATDKIFYSGMFLDPDNVLRNKIYESNNQNGEWQKGELSHFNSGNFAFSHPSLGFDDKLMVFTSDMSGGFGKMDLYYSILTDGLWSEPINLGPNINTEGNELYPFVSDRGFLIFSSDADSKKGLDLFISEISEMNFLAKQKLPKPLNSQYDDFGLIVSPEGKSGFLSSNRPGGKGKDDIYYFKSKDPIFSFISDDFNILSCIIKDSKNNPIPNCIIKSRSLSVDEMKSIDPSIFSFANKIFDSVLSDQEGHAILKLSEKFTLIEISAPEKEPWQQILSNEEDHGELNITLNDRIQTPPVEKVIIKPEPVATINNVKLDVGAVVIFNNIYYDYNSDEIKKGAANELDQLAVIMKENSKLKIQLSAHTDSRGNKDYNKALSERRAIAAKNYLLTKGIESARIVNVGYGESQLRNHCKDGVSCSEAEHVYNRRTEVTILAK